MSVAAWKWLVESGEWEQEYAGVVRRVGAPRTWEQAQMAVCLATDGIASYRAAGVLHGLPEIGPRLEVTIPQRRRTILTGFEAHTTTFLAPVDVTHRKGIPVTSLARTGIDLSLEIPRLAPTLVDFPHCAEGGADRLAGEPSRRYGGRWPKKCQETRRPPGGAQGPPEAGGQRLAAPVRGDRSSLELGATRTLDLFGEGWFIVPITMVQIRKPVLLVERIIAAVEGRRGR